MRLTGQFRKLTTEENGSFMSTVIFLAVIIAIIGVFVIDGTSVFYANQTAAEGAQEAADLARAEYIATRNDTRAEIAAAAHCKAKDLEFIEFRVNREDGHSFDVICGLEANTYVFKYVPVLKELVPQESRKTSNS